MTRKRIQWLAIAVPALLIGVFEYFRHQLLEHQIQGHWGNVAGALIVALGVSGFIRYFIELVTVTEGELGRSRAEAAVLAERQRIAREMHDNVAQALFHLRVRLQEVERYAATGELAKVETEAARLHEHVSQAYDQVRSVIADLKQYASAENPGEALRRGATQAAHDLGLEVQVQIDHIPPLDSSGQQHLLAIITEAMSNAQRHGGATRISLHADSDAIRLADNGHGFDLRRPRTGFGLMIMEERANMIGGTLQITSQPGDGTRIMLRWRETEDANSPLDRG